jgi:hypothetical protein
MKMKTSDNSKNGHNVETSGKIHSVEKITSRDPNFEISKQLNLSKNPQKLKPNSTIGPSISFDSNFLNDISLPICFTIFVDSLHS